MKFKRFFSVFFLILAGVCLSIPGYAAQKNVYEVFFERYAATPHMDSTKTLDEIRDFAKTNPDMMLLLEGYSNADDVRKGVKHPDPVMEELAYGRALFVSRWLKTALGRQDIGETIRSYSGDGAEKLSSHAGRRVVATFYTKKSLPPVLAKERTSGKVPKIYVEESTFRFSGIYEGETLEHDFVVKNTGTDTLDIKSVKPG